MRASEHIARRLNLPLAIAISHNQPPDRTNHIGWWWWWLFAVLAANPACGGGPREFLIQNWTRENGLPGNTVTAVAQTQDGCLWVGTLGGLVRFDGVRFTGVDLKGLAGVRSTVVTWLYSDHPGALWISTGDGHLVRFHQGRFMSYLPPSRRTADSPPKRVGEDQEGTIWSLNYEGGLSRLTGGTFEEAADRADLRTLTADAGGRVWVAAASELLICEGGQLRGVWDATREPGFRPEALATAREGGCWVVGNGRLRRFEGGQPRETRALLAGKAVAPSGLLEDREGNVWLGTYGGGVVMFDQAGAAKPLTREQGLPSDLVRCLFEDREGNMWAGLEGRGLVCIGRAMFASYGRTEGLSGETVLCVCEGEEGEVWVGTNGDGVYRINDGRVRHYGVPEGLTNLFVWTLHRDRAGKLWAGTWGGGLFRQEGERFMDTTPELGPAPVVLALHEDAAGALWLGQRIVDRRLIEAVQQGHRRAYEVPGDLPRIEVSTISETPDGSLWFGTSEEGLLRRKDGAFTRCDAKQGLPSGPIGSMHVDDAGVLWVGVAGFGLVLWDQVQFRAIDAARSLLDDNLNQITDDGLGYLWCGLRSGVVRVKKEDLRRLASGQSARLEWRRFSKADGLPSNECSGNGCRTRDGRIWFPTAAGVAVVDPRHLAANPDPPQVIIEEVLLTGKRIPNGSGRGEEPVAGEKPSLSSASPPIFQLPSSLRIPPGSGPLEISYTALSFAAPERVRFRYQLVGLDEFPVEAGSARAVRYNYLPPGQYEFHVAACYEGGAWNEAKASLAIEVLPRYWQTWWFRLLVLTGLLATTASTARWVITRRLRRRLSALERQRALEAERSRIAQDLHDDLGTSLTEISFLSAIAGSPSSSPTEVKGSLDGISEKSLELVKALDEIVWAVNPKNDSLPNLVNYLCLFAQDYLRPASIQCRLDVPPGLPNLPLNAEQRHTLFLVTKEALANAAKHSAASELWVRVAFKDSLLTLTVEDNGRGFHPATARGDRNGLKNIEARMRHLGGRGTVQSIVDGGTRVELELPLR